jgi:hypothetical protein
LTCRHAGAFLKSDERILGDSDFVEAVLGAAVEQIEEKIVRSLLFSPRVKWAYQPRQWLLVWGFLCLPLLGELAVESE